MDKKHVRVNSAERFKGMQIIPERAVVTYLNPKYLEKASMIVRRSSRRGSYVVHSSVTTLHTWANNVTLSITLYEYLHNEYRPTFVKFHYKFCDFINHDPLLGRLVRENHGIVCPMPKGLHNIVNGTMFFPKFQYVFPFDNCKGVIEYKRIIPTEELIASGELFVTIKQ